MTFSDDILRFDEKAIMSLRALYRRYGYVQYRMSRFEEYGIYSDNKSFLASGNIITFTDSDGKLMALRPDVTLSIVKGVRDGDGLKKLYYNENVYRPDGSGREFRERMQAGLECIGELDVYLMGEVTALAAMSLKALGGSVCLDISHMGFIRGILDSAGLEAHQETELLRLISDKNVPELRKYCRENSVCEDFCEKAAVLASLYGPFDETLMTLRELSVCDKTDTALRELEGIYGVLCELGAADIVKLDFSIINDLDYYSGVIFQGFIDGIPSKVLSGGRYDRLLQKFGKKSDAVGFAVYLDLLEHLSLEKRKGPELDVLLVYDENQDAASVAREVRSLTDGGNSVRVQRTDDGGIKYGKYLRAGGETR